jgi:hypothetical protein
MARIPGGRGDPGREARLAAALKANIGRRKARTRALAEGPDAPDGPAEAPADASREDAGGSARGG